MIATHIHLHRAMRLLFLATAAAGLAGLLAAGGCDDASRGSSGANYVIPMDEPGTALPEWETAITLTNRIPRAVNVNMVQDMKYDDSEPHKFTEGRQIFMNLGYVKAAALRIDGIQEPPGTKIVQIDVSLDGPLPLSDDRGTAADDFIPGPVLLDSIGNAYWPIGYILQAPVGGKDAIEIALDPARQYRDLRSLPALSKNKVQRLTLIFRVNAGVTIESFSYGGHNKRTFTLEIPK